jgi:transcriptional regulator with XRE-family HTH domain
MQQKEVAPLLEVTSETVCNWENNIRRPKIQHIPILIKFLGYDPEPPNPLTIAEHLAAKRRELGWSQRIAAKHLGVDPCTWSSWENGGTIMAIAHRRLVALFLGLPGADVSIEMKRKWNSTHRR